MCVCVRPVQYDELLLLLLLFLCLIVSLPHNQPTAPNKLKDTLLALLAFSRSHPNVTLRTEPLLIEYSVSLESNSVGTMDLMTPLSYQIFSPSIFHPFPLLTTD